jgi:hypothetical protein
VGTPGAEEAELLCILDDPGSRALYEQFGVAPRAIIKTRGLPAA